MRRHTPVWLGYEEQISESLRAGAHPDTSVTFDRTGKQRLSGRFSETPRQIDVVIRGQYARLPAATLIVVDCKCIQRKVGVERVEAFAGLVQDVGADAGILVTTRGFSKPAQLRARAYKDMLLDVVPLDELREWMQRRPTVGLTRGANWGSFTYWDGSEWVTRIVDRELAERLVGTY